MDEMIQFGIPASITLAQGILESGSGKGRLAVEANNHFGIKCHDWSGKKIYHDDDEEQECFRKYDNPEYSYRDHSLFLSNRGRYSFLFDLKPSLSISFFIALLISKNIKTKSKIKKIMFKISNNCKLSSDNSIKPLSMKVKKVKKPNDNVIIDNIIK